MKFTTVGPEGARNLLREKQRRNRMAAKELRVQFPELASIRIDFAFSVVAEVAGETTARTIQLGLEYDPTPPFDSGNPDRASTAIKSAVLSEGYDKSMSAYRAGID